MHLRGWSKLPWSRQRFLPVSEVPLDVPTPRTSSPDRSWSWALVHYG